MRGKNIFLYFFSLLLATSSFATVRTVNNSFVPVSAGQYGELQTAINASSSGDTILVAGSGQPYSGDNSLNSTIVLAKPLTIIGAGYNPKGLTLPSRIACAFVVYPAASASTISGFQFDGTVTFSFPSTAGHHKNIYLTRNYFQDVVFLNRDSATNCRFVGNIFGANSYLNVRSLFPSSLVVSNNVFIGNAVAYDIAAKHPFYQNLVVDHNLFMIGRNGTTSYAFSASTGGILWDTTRSSTTYAQVSNNIFYNMAACVTTSGANTSYMTMNNNLTYFPGGATGAPTMPYSGSTGSGNLNNSNPLMVTLFSSTTNVFLDLDLDNLSLQSSSPCRTAGSDATNIGPTGGIAPIYNTNATSLTGEPNIPSVRSITFPSGATVPAGATLNVTITAKKMN